MQNKFKTMQVIRPDVKAMHAYVVQDSKGFVKLDAMENPYTLNDSLQAELGKRLGSVAVNRYPGQRIHDLQNALAQYCNLPENYALILGNGSDELISMLAIAIDQPDASIMAPLPGFVMYEMSAKLQGIPFIGVDLTANFELDVESMLQAIHTHQPALVYLAYPNNPTANLWSDDDMHSVIQACETVGSWVVIDEAYQPFASHSFIEEMTQYQNVLLLRTLSKFGLAGIRLGYLIGPSSIISQIDKVRPPYNISVLNAECALFALEHQHEFKHQAQLICQERESLLAQLGQMSQLQVYSSQANMILLRLHQPHIAADVFKAMREQGVLIKNVSSLHHLLDNCLRITVGTTQENQQMMKALKACL